MSEVVNWDPSDNANTATPPNGWPEGMQPSAVNDTGRMMMGAIKRYSQTVTAQIGATPGTINTTNIYSSTVNTTGAITAGGAITAPAINSTGNASVGGTLTAGAITVPGITYTIGPGHAISFGWDGNLHSYVDGSYIGALVRQVTAGNGLTGGGGPTSGTVTLAMSGSYGGAFSATTSLYSPYISSGGNIDAAGQIAGNTVVANDLVANGNLFARYIIYGNTGGNLVIGSNAIPLTDGGNYCGLASNAWYGVEAYNYYTKSDPSLKRDIAPAPPGCLALVNAIEPKTYKLNLEADGGKTHWGFLAPEVGEAMQRAGLKFDGVHTEGDAPSSLAYNEMIAVLWGAVQELTKQVETLKREKADV